MKWISHHIVTAVAVLGITDNPVAAWASFMGSTVPDYIEFKIPLKLVKHRTLTHWWPVYVVPCLILWLMLRMKGVPLIPGLDDLRRIWEYYPLAELIFPMALWLLFWFIMGSVFHLIEDLMTGYLPLLNPYDERKIKIFFYPGSPKEYAFDLIFCSGVLLWKFAVWHRFLAG